MSRPPLWQLPPGVASGTWEYAHSPQIANQYDHFLAGSSICRIDEQLVQQYLPGAAKDEAPVVIDLGCGTGRTLVSLAQRGYRAIGVDLSQTMLQRCLDRATKERVELHLLRANLVQLGAIRDEAVDHAVCLFSTLGMIQGRKNRSKTLEHVVRMLRPGGLFILHVHNRWAALGDPGGLRWLVGSSWKAWRRDDWELGDRVYPYRGLPDMFLHSFTRRELQTDLEQVGLAVELMHPLTRKADAILPAPARFASLRAGGYIAVARKP